MTSPRVALLAALLALWAVGGCASGLTAATPAPEAATGSGAPLPSGHAAPRPLLIDTDVAPDDLVAIAFLLASPGVDVRAITVSGTGEAHCGPGVDVVLRLLERLEAPPIDVACGRDTPIAGDHAFPDAWREGADDASGLTLPATTRQPFAGSAVDLIARTAGEVRGLRVLTLGPLTNLADALEQHPDLPERLESVYAMGGALHVPGNVAFGGPPDNAVAEWNIYVDPSAAQRVFDSGVPVRLVSLDGTNQVPVTRGFAERVQAEGTGPGSRVLADLFVSRPFMADGSYYLWDPLAAAMAADHPLGAFRPATVVVETAEGPESGFTRPVAEGVGIEYLGAVDASGAETVLFETLDQAPSP